MERQVVKACRRESHTLLAPFHEVQSICSGSGANKHES